MKNGNDVVAEVTRLGYLRCASCYRKKGAAAATGTAVPRDSVHAQEPCDTCGRIPAKLNLEKERRATDAEEERALLRSMGIKK